MKTGSVIALFYAAALLSSCAGSSVSSPDGSISFRIDLDKEGRPTYEVSKDGETVIENSALGFTLKDAAPLESGFRIESIEKASTDTVWEQVWGESRFVSDRHNEMTVHLQEKASPNRRLDIRIRVFDDGFGFRYEFPEQENLNDFAIMDELRIAS